jgi:hypothetical protein
MARSEDARGRLQAELERLYALPPAAFTAARNELATRLRRDGDREAAAEVKALPRPTASSWAVSRLMRLEPHRWKALLAAGEEARAAQRQVAAGRGAASGAAAGRLRETLQEARRLIEELRRRGLELLGTGGRPAPAQVADQLAANLQALTFTVGAADATAGGWLDHDLEPPGFEVLAGLQAAAGPAAPPRRETPERPAPAASLAQPGAPLPRKPPLRAAARPAPAAASDRGRAPGPAPVPRAGPSASRRQAEPGTEEEEARRQAERRAPQEQARQEALERVRRQREERQRARVAAAEVVAERAATDLAERQAAARAAEEAAAAASRQAAEAARQAERARQRAEQARDSWEQARQRLDAARAALAAAST